MIQEQAEWSTPAAMASKIQSLYPQVTTKQIHAAWRELSQSFWRRDDNQLTSAQKLLAEYGDDVDIFEPDSLPDCVEMLAWGMKRIAESLQGKVVEIGMDATCKSTYKSGKYQLNGSKDNTNSKHLELYSIMGEHDNAGFPLTYCLLSTATAIDQGKRTKALSAWAQCLRDKYGVHPIFIHTDKDMAEIGCSKAVWEAKINLCWWHLRRAVRTRLAKAKLSTTPYNVERAMAEFGFISDDFLPYGKKTDAEDYEGGLPDSELPPLVDATVSPPESQPITQQTTPLIRPLTASTQPWRQPLGDTTNSIRIKLPLSNVAAAVGRVIHGAGFRLNIAATQLPVIEEEQEVDETTTMENEPASVSDSDEDDGKSGRRTFCPALYRDHIINMMERHYCAHPLIPGYGPPDAPGIRRWAVQQIYNFCVKHDLPEVWVYLWENWYRRGRWELWARSAHSLIPVLKTTMILESQ